MNYPLIFNIIFAVLLCAVLGAGATIHHVYLIKYFPGFKIVKYMMYTTLLLALTIITKLLDTEVFQLNSYIAIIQITYIFIFFSGLVIGPFYGSFVGLFSDLLGTLIFGTKGVFFLGFTFAATLAGFIGGFCIFTYLKFFKKSSNYKLNLASAIIINVILLIFIGFLVYLFFIPNDFLIKQTVNYDLNWGVKIIYFLLAVGCWLIINLLIIKKYWRKRTHLALYALLCFFLLTLFVTFILDLFSLHLLYKLPLVLLFSMRLATFPINFSISTLLLLTLIYNLKVLPSSFLLYETTHENV